MLSTSQSNLLLLIAVPEISGTVRPSVFKCDVGKIKVENGIGIGQDSVNYVDKFASGTPIISVLINQCTCVSVRSG